MKHFLYKTAGKILGKIGLEVHYKTQGYSWVSLPLPRLFIETYERYRVKEVSYVNVGSLHSLYQFLSYARRLPGDVAQWGGSVALLASLVESTGKEYHLFDTFDGLPPTSDEDNVNGYVDSEEKEMADAPIGEVKKYLKDYNCLRFHKGYFPKTASPMEDKKFCFVYLDADIYQSTKDGLEFFYPRLSQGGVVAIDDYGGRRWAGVKTAVHEFLGVNKGSALMQIASGQAIIIKT